VETIAISRPCFKKSTYFWENKMKNLTPVETFGNSCVGMWQRNLKELVIKDDVGFWVNKPSWEENLSMYVASHQKKDYSDLEIVKVALKTFIRKRRRNGK